MKLTINDSVKNSNELSVDKQLEYIKSNFTVQTILESYQATGYTVCKLTFLKKVNGKQYACIVPALLSHVCHPKPSRWESFVNSIGKSFFLGLMDGWNGWDTDLNTNDPLLNYGREIGVKCSEILQPKEIQY